jgi:hypothetical protein
MAITAAQVSATKKSRATQAASDHNCHRDARHGARA